MASSGSGWAWGANGFFVIKFISGTPDRTGIVMGEMSGLGSDWVMMGPCLENWKCFVVMRFQTEIPNGFDTD